MHLSSEKTGNQCFAIEKPIKLRIKKPKNKKEIEKGRSLQMKSET
jgi:hypothetical protein